MYTDSLSDADIGSITRHRRPVLKQHTDAGWVNAADSSGFGLWDFRNSLDTALSQTVVHLRFAALIIQRREAPGKLWYDIQGTDVDGIDFRYALGTELVWVQDGYALDVPPGEIPEGGSA